MCVCVGVRVCFVCVYFPDYGCDVHQELPCQGQPGRSQWDQQHGGAPQPQDAVVDVGQALERDVRLSSSHFNPYGRALLCRVLRL